MKAIKSILLVGFIFTQFFQMQIQMAQASDKFGSVSIYEAAHEGRTEAVETFIKNGNDINTKDHDGNTVLHHAARNGKTETTKIILAVNGIDINITNDRSETALHKAALWGKTETVKMLIDAGAAADVKDWVGNIALHLAAGYYGHFETVKILLAVRGVDINATNKDGTTALHTAVGERQLEVVEILIAKGADANIKNKDGETPIDVARRLKNIIFGDTADDVAGVKKYFKIIELLENQKQLDAKKQIENQKLKIPTLNKNLLEAARIGDAKKTQQLLDEGADVNAQDKLGWTALILAANNGYSEVVDALIKAGFDINAKAKFGKTALHDTAVNGRTEVAKILIDAGADVEARDNDGETALHYAAYWDHPEVVEVLLDAGADVHVKNKYDRSPADMAQRMEHTDISNQLENQRLLNAKKQKTIKRQRTAQQRKDTKKIRNAQTKKDAKKKVTSQNKGSGQKKGRCAKVF